MGDTVEFGSKATGQCREAARRSSRRQMSVQDIPIEREM